MASEWIYTLLILAVSAERLVELRRSRVNAAEAVKDGGVERGQGHFRWMKLLHTSFLIGCLVEVWVFGADFDARFGWIMLGLVLLAQGLRYWAVLSLGPYWNVRVIARPGAAVVTSGPYRYLRHPNYVAVIVEGFALPLVHGAVVTAVAFSVLNAILLRVRIRCEERLLRDVTEYDGVFGDKPRFHPSLTPPQSPDSQTGS